MVYINFGIIMCVCDTAVYLTVLMEENRITDYIRNHMMSL